MPEMAQPSTASTRKLLLANHVEAESCAVQGSFLAALVVAVLVTPLFSRQYILH